MAVGLQAATAQAQIPVSRLAGSPETLRHLQKLSDAPLLVRRAASAESEPAWRAAAGKPGWVPLSSSFALSAEPAPGLSAVWSPPKRLLLDRARSTVRAAQHRKLVAAYGSTGSGAGVAIGIIDSGVDLEHPDLRDAQGKTRVAWMLEFGAGPFGFFPEMEEELGCGRTRRCGVLSAAELDQLLSGSLMSPAGDRIRLPEDVLGHGTHVASLAAGNGRSNPDYAGMAPEASLIIAQVAQRSISVTDADILLASKFAFDRAQELGMPAVLNLSLGGDFGPHDGTSEIGLALAELLEVKAGEPGRAIIVAAGNSGSLSSPGRSSFPTPQGIHTDVHVPDGSSVRVPLLMPPGEARGGAAFIWLAFRPGDDIRVGVEQGDGTVAIEPLSLGEVSTVNNGRIEISAVVGLSEDFGLGESSEHAAAVIIDGQVKGGEVFAVRLEGHGSVSLWVQSEGGIGPGGGGAGALFPRATRSQTINIPADVPQLIAVGATLNRDSWPSRDHDLVQLDQFSEDFELEPGGLAFFSSAGPNSVGSLKPDLVAPGAAVIGAMAAAADPESLTFDSIFSFSALCDGIGCAVVDDEHAATLGTSMAAPMVAGAAALLLEQEPSLRQEDIRALLQAGSRAVPNDIASEGAPPTLTQAGAGVLNLEQSARSLLARQGELQLAAPSAGHCRLTLSDEFARPDPSWRLSGLLHLRDAQGKLAHAELGQLELRVRSGRVLEPLSSQTPGLYSFAVAGNDSTAGETLEIDVLFEGQPLVSLRRPIEVDSGVFEGGVSVRGGCAVPLGLQSDGGLQSTQVPAWAWSLALIGCAWIRRRRVAQLGSSVMYKV